MWKNILWYILFMTICFMLPCVFLDIDMTNSNKINIEDEIIKSGDVIKKESGDTIKLLLKESNKIIELSMDDYIKGVVLRRNANHI